MISDYLQNTDTTFNKYQSTLDDIGFYSWPDEIREQFLEYITVVPFIRNLITIKRPYVQDLQRDGEGKAIIDLTNPPLYTGADFFTPTANLYKEKGVLNPYHPNKNPQSDYYKYIGTDVRRAYNGYLNPATGMWIPGDMYWYVNYCIIQQNVKNSNGLSYKKEDIPRFWEGQWWRFLGWDMARKQGLNFAEIASRRKGKAHPYSQLVYTPKGPTHWGNIKVGDTLFGPDGRYTKVIDIPFDEEIDIYTVTLSDGRTLQCSLGHEFVVWDKKTNIKSTYTLEDIIEDTYYMYENGDPRFFINTANPVEFEERGVPIPPYSLGTALSTISSKKRFIPEEYLYNTKEVRIGVLQGLLDNSKTIKYENYSVITTDSKELSENIEWLCRSLGLSAEVFKEGEYLIKIGNEERLGIIGIEYSHEEKAKCVTVDNESHCYLIGDFIITHNSYTAAGHACRDFYLGENEFHRSEVRDLFIADNTQYLIVDGTLNKFESMINFVATHTQLPKMRLKDNLKDMNWVLGYTDLNTKLPAGLQNQVMGLTISDDPDKPRGKAAAFIFFEEFGSFGRLQQTYDTVQYSVREGNDVTGMCVLAGTGGTKGSAFRGALDMVYNPDGILPFDNVWDITNNGKSIFFFPAYVNYGGCYNEDGISDVTKALGLILRRRYRKKYGSANPSSLAQAVAEEPITIQDSIMKTDVSIFPVTALTERLLEIDKNPNMLSDIYTGIMVLNSRGEAEFRPTNDPPLRQFPHSAGDKIAGAIEIIEMPIKDKDNKVPYGRYISCLDPVEDDSNNSNSLSLQSFFMFDLWTDSIVAEYTGRTEFASDFYEQTRLLNMFYNAKMMYENNKKGPFSYYQRMHSLKYMAETPDYLKSKGLQPRYSIGNKAYGIHNIGSINATGLEFLRDWLCSAVTTYVPDEENEHNVKEVEMMRLYTIKNRAFLQELTKYTNCGNYDRISAMIMLMLYREERLIVKGTNDWDTFDKKAEDSEEKTFFNEYERRSQKKSKVLDI